MLGEVIREAEALLLTHLLETSAASVHCILRQKECDRQDDECEEAKDREDSKRSEAKEWVHLVFNIGHDIKAAELARLLHWVDIKEIWVIGCRKSWAWLNRRAFREPLDGYFMLLDLFSFHSVVVVLLL